MNEPDVERQHHKIKAPMRFGKYRTAARFFARPKSVGLVEQFGIIIGPTIERIDDRWSAHPGERTHINRITLSAGLRQRRGSVANQT